jgi:uncharacterized C2H2 Zn-finger protein
MPKKKAQIETIESDNPRQTCPKCGAVYRYDVDFQEHLKLGCKIESGKGDSLAHDPDEEKEESQTPQE